MNERLSIKKIKGKVYYYLQKSWREKIEAGGGGKTKGTGKSRTRTESIYLGTEEIIVELIKQSLKSRKPAEIRHREFGFVAAVYQTAIEIGLVDLLKEYITGSRYGVERWLYFLLPIINRLQHATSKEQMGEWVAKTILPDLLGFDARRLSSNSFWYATEDLISEKELRKRRAEKAELKDDLFAGIDNKVFSAIEERLFLNIKEQFGLSSDALIYDTTNFFTYIEEPVRSQLARNGDNKALQHHLKQVGLAVCVDKEWGIPLFHRLYRGNSQDVKTFSGVVSELLDQMKRGFNEIENLVLILDKGNNSEENFQKLQGKVKWVGSLVLSNFADLAGLSLESYTGKWKDSNYHCLTREVMGVNCALVLTYNACLARKQEHTLQQGIARLKEQIQQKLDQYKRRPKEITEGITTLLDQSHYGKYIRPIYQDGNLIFEETKAIVEKRKRFGKNLLFTNELAASADWVITQYHAKNKVEDGFKLLKNLELICWQPARHWTDSKIRAFGFCAIMSLVLIRVMELKAVQAELRMSPALLKQELSDIRELILIYEQHGVSRQISSRSSVQQQLFNLFDLGKVAEALAIG
ncbi:MAG: IS1634 family transposase [Acidobacteriota bacterium]